MRPPRPTAGSARAEAVTRAWATRRAAGPKRRSLPCGYRGCKSPRKAATLCAKHYAWMKRGRLQVDALNDAALSGRLEGFKKQAQDRACRTCGCPTSFGLCSLCAGQVFWEVAA